MTNFTFGQAHARAGLGAAGILALTIGAAGISNNTNTLFPENAPNLQHAPQSSKALYPNGVPSATEVYQSKGHRGGIERWAAKVGNDADAATIPLNAPTATTVHALRAAPRPSDLPLSAQSDDSLRHGVVEHTLYAIDCYIDGYKRESDSDIHVVISDQPIAIQDSLRDQKTMIVEFPDVDVVPPSSTWRGDIERARTDFDMRFPNAEPRLTRCAIHARVTGIGFFDFLHGQTGVAPNGVELHPVLKVEWLTNDAGAHGG